MNADQLGVILARTVAGDSCYEIGEELGVAHTTVLRARRRPEVKEQIERELSKLMFQGLPVSRKLTTRLVAEALVKGATPETKALGLQAARTVFQHANSSGNTFIANFVNNIAGNETTVNVLAPNERVQAALSKALGGLITEPAPVPSEPMQGVVDCAPVDIPEEFR